jgi:agmatinase
MGGFGILQIDAHADLRDAYEGFTYSHASIMFNALQNEQVKKISTGWCKRYL